MKAEEGFKDVREESRGIDLEGMRLRQLRPV